MPQAPSYKFPTPPPPLPVCLLQVWPPITIGIVGFFLATILSMIVPSLHHWQPIALGGLVVGMYGIVLFGWQRSAARRGSSTAQTGLDQLRD